MSSGEPREGCGWGCGTVPQALGLFRVWLHSPAACGRGIHAWAAILPSSPPGEEAAVPGWFAFCASLSSVLFFPFSSVLCLQPPGTVKRLDPAKGAAAEPACGKAGAYGSRIWDVFFSLQRLSGCTCKNEQVCAVASLYCQVCRSQRQFLNAGKQQACPVAPGLEEWLEHSLDHRHQALACSRSSTGFLKGSELEQGKSVAHNCLWFQSSASGELKLLFHPSDSSFAYPMEQNKPAPCFCVFLARAPGWLPAFVRPFGG